MGLFGIPNSLQGVIIGVGSVMIAQWIGHSDEIEPAKMAMKDVQAVAEGLLQGALQVEGLDDIASCVEDSSKIVEDIEKAAAHFSRHTLSDIMDGLQDLSEVCVDLHAAMEECHSGNFTEELKLFEKMIKEFRHPVKVIARVGSHLILNGKDIWADIKGALRAHQKQQWKTFGNDIGQALALAFFGKIDPGYLNIRMRVVEITKGVMEEAFDAKDFGKIKKCMLDGQQVYSDFSQTIEQFSKKDLKGFKKGLRYIGFAMTHTTQALVDCNLSGDTEKLRKVVKDLMYPDVTAFKVG